MLSSQYRPRAVDAPVPGPVLGGDGRSRSTFDTDALLEVTVRCGGYASGPVPLDLRFGEGLPFVIALDPTDRRLEEFGWMALPEPDSCTKCHEARRGIGLGQLFMRQLSGNQGALNWVLGSDHGNGVNVLFGDGVAPTASGDPQPASGGTITTSHDTTTEVEQDVPPDHQ